MGADQSAIDIIRHHITAQDERQAHTSIVPSAWGRWASEEIFSPTLSETGSAGFSSLFFCTSTLPLLTLHQTNTAQ